MFINLTANISGGGFPGMLGMGWLGGERRREQRLSWTLAFAGTALAPTQPSATLEHVGLCAAGFTPQGTSWKPRKAELNEKAIMRLHLTLVNKTPGVGSGPGLGPDSSMQPLAQSPDSSMGACCCFHEHHISSRAGKARTPVCTVGMLSSRAGTQSRSQMPAYMNYLGCSHCKWWEQNTGPFLARVWEEMCNKAEQSQVVGLQSTEVLVCCFQWRACILMISFKWVKI